jgi:hypothetical protein
MTLSVQEQQAHKALTVEEQQVRKEAAVGYATVRDAWQRYFHTWFAAHYILGTLLFICSATVASSKQFEFSPFWSGIFAWLVVILTAAIGFYKPEDRGSRYRQAWSLLSVQLSRFDFDSSYTLNDVIRAYEQGESIIHQTPAVPHPPQGSGARG